MKNKTIATTIRHRGNAWQVRVGSGKAQHSVGSFDTLEEALKVKEQYIAKGKDDKAKDYDNALRALAKQIAEEAVRDRKEYIEEFLVANSSSTTELLRLGEQVAVLAVQDFNSVEESEEAEETLALDAYKEEAAPDTDAVDKFANLDEEVANALYRHYYEVATHGTDGFDDWLNGLKQSDLDLLETWLVQHKWA